MKATLKKDEGLKKEFEVVVPAEEFSKRKEAELTKLSKEVKVEGFRPGKVPMNVMQQKYGDRVIGDVIDNIVKESISRAINENDLRPVLEPSIKAEEQFEEGKDFKYSFSVEIFPEVPELDAKKISLTKQVAEAGDDEVKEALESIAAQVPNLEPISGNRAAKKGDTVDIDFLGKKDGVAFDGGKGENHRLELGSGSFIPGFEDQVIGMKKSETKVITVTFPEEYHSPDLAGAEATFDVTINDILEAGEAKIDDKFAETIGYESLDKLKEAITKQLERDFESVSFTKTKKELFDKMDADIKFEVPQGMVDLDKASITQQIKQEKPDAKEADVEKEAIELAERRVRLGILLSELGKKNNIQVSEDEIRQSIMAKASSFPGQQQQVIEFYSKNPQALEQVRGEILEDKVVEFIISQADVKEVKVSKDELMKEDEAPAKPKKAAAKKSEAKKTTKKKS